MTPLVEIAEIVSRIESWNPAQTSPDSDITYIDIASVNRETKQIDNVSSILGKDAPSRARQIVKGGDVLVSTVRPNLNAVAFIPEIYNGATASTGYCVLRPVAEKCDGRYLFHWVKTQSFINSMVKQATGASYPAVSDRIVKSSKIPIPPLSEQRRIATILDKADAVRRKREEAIRLAEEFLRSVFLDMFGDPVTNPKGWEVKPLRDLVTFVSGGTPSKAKPEYWSGKFPWVSPKDMKSREIYDAIDHVSAVVFEETSLKKVGPENLLIVVRGMILAHTVPIAITSHSVAINQDMKALIPREGILPYYLFWNLQTMHDYILRNVATAAHGTKRIETSCLEELPILCPSKDAQVNFSNIAKRFSGIEKKIFNGQIRSTDFFNSLAQRAFRGDL